MQTNGNYSSDASVVVFEVVVLNSIYFYLLLFVFWHKTIQPILVRSKSSDSPNCHSPIPTFEANHVQFRSSEIFINEKKLATIFSLQAPEFRI